MAVLDCERVQPGRGKEPDAADVGALAGGQDHPVSDQGVVVVGDQTHPVVIDRRGDDRGVPAAAYPVLGQAPGQARVAKLIAGQARQPGSFARGPA